MKLSRIIFEILLFLTFLNIGSGYLLELVGESYFENPDFFIFHLNPRIDRFLYYLLRKTSVFLCFFILAYTLDVFVFLTKFQRIALKGVEAYFLAELFTTYLVQFFLSGQSANFYITILFALFVLINRLILDRYFPREQFKKD